MASIKLHEFIERMNLKNLSPGVDLSERVITESQVNRPALQLSGYFEHFDSRRVQVMGNVEVSYMETFDRSYRLDRYEKLFAHGEKDIPCMVFCRGLMPEQEVIDIAAKYNIPVLLSDRMTSEFMASTIRWLNVKLAPCVSIHGVLVDVYGEGLLIIGESGVGKSEAALVLIRRGHRLVTDDVVEIKRVSDETLIGSSPEVTKNFIELRGIGIIDVKTLFGVECVKENMNINLVVKLEEWKDGTNFDRVGLDEEYMEFLGVKVVCQTIPIRPGRNLAVICETAAVNHRQKKMGYNATKELYKRVQNNLKKG
ncbi:MAG: HPr(Ser) kinase/phosphatase [Lachnospiraceae bacterium]|nr:HPr(Ser) kinase/phosphatase [Lachnospiraceae bacterium]